MWLENTNKTNYKYQTLNDKQNKVTFVFTLYLLTLYRLLFMASFLPSAPIFLIWRLLIRSFHLIEVNIKNHINVRTGFYNEWYGWTIKCISSSLNFFILPLQCITFQNGQTNFENLAANGVRFLTHFSPVFYLCRNQVVDFY